MSTPNLKGIKKAMKELRNSNAPYTNYPWTKKNITVEMQRSTTKSVPNIKLIGLEQFSAETLECIRSIIFRYNTTNRKRTRDIFDNDKYTLSWNPVDNNVYLTVHK